MSPDLCAGTCRYRGKSDIHETRQGAGEGSGETLSPGPVGDRVGWGGLELPHSPYSGPSEPVKRQQTHPTPWTEPVHAVLLS